MKKQEKKEGTLPPLLEFYQRLLHIQSEVERRVGVPEPGLTSETISDRIEHGLPLVAFNELDLDWSLLPDILAKVTAVFADYAELFGQLPESLKDNGAAHFLTKEVVKAWFEGSRLPATIAADNINEPLLENIIQATLSPFLASYSKAVLGYVNQELWRRGYCPICGGNPDFAFLDRERGARWLLCSRCDAEWLFQRLECPYCGSKDQDALAYFTNDKGLYRLYVCEQCKRYLKAIDLRQTESEVLMPLERLLTLGIDAQALEYGYNPCGRISTKLTGGKAD